MTKRIMTAGVPWVRVWLLALVVGLVGISANEYLLRCAGHRPSLVADPALWGATYGRFLETSTARSVVLLGASRMQANIDLDVVREQTDCDQVYQLALSGRGSARAIFEAIVRETDFVGTVILSETEATLVSDGLAQAGILRKSARAPLDSSLNRRIANSLQSRFVFLNPNSSSLRLWGNLLIEREWPEAVHVITHPDRSQDIDFSMRDVDRISNLRAETMRQGEANQAPSVDPETWMKAALSNWQPSVETFTARGGTVVFVRFPVSSQRWQQEGRVWPVAEFWNPLMERLQVSTVHFADYPNMSVFELPDSSHIDFKDKPKFTRQLFQLDSMQNLSQRHSKNHAQNRSHHTVLQ